MKIETTKYEDHMKRGFEIVTSLFVCFVIITIGSIVIVAQESISGTWTADGENWNRDNKGDTEKTDKDIYLKFSYEKNKDGENHKSSHGSTFSFADLNGLTKAQTEGENSPVKFRLVREAGTIECEGVFRKGKGIGEFKFVSNQSYSSAMKSKGFEFSDSQLFSAVTLDLKMVDVDDLRSAGFANLTTSDLFKAKIFKVNSSFKKEMARAGFPDLTMQDLVKARIFKVDASFVKTAHDMGVVKDSFGEIIKLKIHKVSPEYLKGMRAAGFPDLSASQAVKLRIFKVTPEFIGEMKSLGFSDLSVSDATKLSIHKVTPEFMKEMRDLGISNISISDATRLRIFKIDGDFVRKAKAQSSNELTARDLVNMKINRKLK